MKNCSHNPRHQLEVEDEWQDHLSIIYQHFDKAEMIPGKLWSCLPLELCLLLAKRSWEAEHDVLPLTRHLEW